MENIIGIIIALVSYLVAIVIIVTDIRKSGMLVKHVVCLVCIGMGIIGTPVLYVNFGIHASDIWLIAVNSVLMVMILLYLIFEPFQDFFDQEY